MKQKSWIGRNWLILLGVAALVLSALGNPGNMGFCIACFERDIAGSVGLHSAGKVQYFRPEIVGIVFGALLMAVGRKEFKGKAGSSPVLRFVLGAAVMIGALVFLGCPSRRRRSERHCRPRRLHRRHSRRRVLPEEGLHAAPRL